jgi:UDP-3-O-[3-hydroxymyristoyl] glucosamine N-acyltransferase
VIDPAGVGAPAAVVADFSLGDIAAELGGELIGDAAIRITCIEPLETAGAGAISFLSNPRYGAQLASTQAACVIVAPAMRDAAVVRGAVIVAADPYLYFARLTRWWAAHTRAAMPGGVHPSAVVHPSASLAPGVSIGPLVVIEQGVQLGAGVVVGAHCSIGEGTRIGEQTRLAARVSIAAGCMIGARCIVHSGVVIGADGFGFAPNQGRWEKIEQLGGVRIGDDVEIGANTCIDRGALGDTVIEDGVKLDNLIQIGHNVQIGKHTAMAGCVGIAGSARIGAHCTVGGAAGIAGHITIGDHVHIGPMAIVSHSIAKPGHYSGVFPIDDNAAWLKNAAAVRQLSAMRERLRALEKRLLKDGPNDSGPNDKNTAERDPA